MSAYDKEFFKQYYAGNVSLPDDFLRTYFRTFKIGRLYFKYIKGTDLEYGDWTAEKLAPILVDAGIIKFVTLQATDEKGRFTKGEQRYVEMPGKAITKAELVRFLKERKVS